MTPRYALYAREPESADELEPWLDAELTVLAARGLRARGPGLVLAIETGPERVAGLPAHGRAPRKIHWTSPIRNQVINSTGRPYTFFREPYFTESFVVPLDEAGKLGIVTLNMPSPAWVCLVTTERHVRDAFDTRAKQHERAIGEASKNEELSFDQAVVGALFWIALQCSLPEYRRIDLELMRLQRREALAEALIRSAPPDSHERATKLERLEQETDEAWKELYVSRPIE